MEYKDNFNENKINDLNDFFNFEENKLKKSKIKETKLNTKILLNDNTINIIKKRLCKINNEYTFNQNYSECIIQFFQKFNAVLIAKIDNAFNFSTKFSLFFKLISQCYEKFSKDIEKTNELIGVNNNYGMILNNSINILMEKTQQKISLFFENFSNQLNKKMIQDGINEIKIKDFQARLFKINNDFDEIIIKVTKFKSIISKEYIILKKKLEELKLNIANNTKYIQKIIKNDDFFYLEYNLILFYMKLNLQIKDFLLIYKENLLHLQVLIIDYSNYLKDFLEIYNTENKKIFNFNDFSEDFIYFEESSNNINNIFSIKNILDIKNIDIDNEYLKILNEYLNEYYKNLKIGNFKNYGNIDFRNIEKFKLENYKNVNEFIEFMILITPIYEINLDELIIDKFQIQNENSPQDSYTMIFSIQENVFIISNYLLINNTNDSKIIAKFNLKNFKFQSSQKENYFILKEKKKGILFHSNKTFEFNAMSNENFQKIKNLCNMK